MSFTLIVYASTQIMIGYYNIIESIINFMTSHNVRSLLLWPAAAYSQHHMFE